MYNTLMQPDQNNQPPLDNRQPVEVPVPQATPSDHRPEQTTQNMQPEQSAQDQPPAGPEAGWRFTPDQPQQDSTLDVAPETAAPVFADVTWSASEFIEHYKSPVWYIGLAGVTLVAASLTYLLTKDVITTAMLGIIGLAFGIVAGRPPRTLSYKMNGEGVYIQGKFTPFYDFKSFSVTDEGAVSMVSLVPLKRFMPLTYIYYPPEQEDALMAILSEKLPYEERRNDPIDNLISIYEI